MTEDANPGGRCDERKAAPADYARKYWWVVAVAVPVVVALIGVLPDLFKRESSGPATNITASYGGTVVTGGTLISGNKFKSKLIIIGGDDLANDPKLADALKDPALRQKFDDAMNLVKEQNYLRARRSFKNSRNGFSRRPCTATWGWCTRGPAS